MIRVAVAGVLLIGAVVATTVLAVPAAYVFAPLLGMAILWIGLGSLRSLQTGAAHVPSAPPRAVDPASERVTYSCGGCGAEMVLLVRGTDVPPRHCGERMRERVELAGNGRQADR